MKGEGGGGGEWLELHPGAYFSWGGGMFLCYFLAKPKGGTEARPSSQVRGRSGHLPSWVHEFSQVEGEGLGAGAAPAPTMCQASQIVGSSQVSLMKILVGKNHPDPSSYGERQGCHKVT